MEGEWQEFKLADVCDSIDEGFTTSAKEQPVGPKFLRITDIVSGYIDWDTVPFCECEPTTAKKYRLHDGDIVIARTGASTGSSMYISNPPSAVFGSYLVRLRTNKTAHSRFISYFLKSPAFWTYMIGVLGDKSAQPNASAKTMTQVKLRRPAIEEQRAIAHILGSLDDKIELNRRMNETLEAIARAIFKSWFVDFDPVCAKAEGRDTGLPGEIADLFPDSFEDSEMGAVPEGWKATTLNDGIEIFDSVRIPLNKRQRAERQGIYPYYGAASIMDHVDDFLFDGVYVLTGEDGSVADDDGHPVVQYVWGQFWVNNHAHILKGKNGISEEHLYLFLQQTTVAAFVTGAVQPKLNQKNLKAVPLVLPKGPVCRAFSDLIQPLFSKLRANADETATLISLRDILLPKLISGELRVSDAEKFIEEGSV